MKTFIKYEFKMKILSECKIHLSINDPLSKHTVKLTLTEKQHKVKEKRRRSLSKRELHEQL